jgi:uncharacterized membrane protein YgcG
VAPGLHLAFLAAASLMLVAVAVAIYSAGVVQGVLVEVVLGMVHLGNSGTVNTGGGGGGGERSGDNGGAGGSGIVILKIN